MAPKEKRIPRKNPTPFDPEQEKLISIDHSLPRYAYQNSTREIFTYKILSRYVLLKDTSTGSFHKTTIEDFKSEYTQLVGANAKDPDRD